MNVDFKTDAITKEISAEIARLPELTQSAERKVMKEIAKVLVTNVKKNLPRSKVVNSSNYDGSVPYIHMKDDVKSTISQKNGFTSVTVHGGKKTAFKWHLLNNGVYDSNGNLKTKATHFVDLAVLQSQPEIDKFVDKIISEVANGR